MSLCCIWPARPSPESLPINCCLTSSWLAGWLVHGAQGHRSSSHHGPRARSRNPQTEGFSRANTLKGKRYSPVNPICKVKPW